MDTQRLTLLSRKTKLNVEFPKALFKYTGAYHPCWTQGRMVRVVCVCVFVYLCVCVCVCLSAHLRHLTLELHRHLLKQPLKLRCKGLQWVYQPISDSVVTSRYVSMIRLTG